MRLSYHGIVSIAVALLSGCTNQCCQPTSTKLAANFVYQQKVVATTKENYPAKNAKNIALYANQQKPLTPYRVIGVATVSKHNLLGVERQQQSIHAIMKNLAASIGGDGLINVNSDADNVQAHVIRYQRILI